MHWTMRYPLPYNNCMDHSPVVNASRLILIVDKDNVLGSGLTERLSPGATVVLVSSIKSLLDEAVIYVSLGQVKPQIPDGIYTTIFFVWHKENKDILKPLSKKAQAQGKKFFLAFDRE